MPAYTPTDPGRPLDVNVVGGEVSIEGDVIVDEVTLGAGDANIGNVDVLTLPALVAGTANIGDVDVASIAAGDNNIGNVDVVSLPALPAGSNTIGTVNTSVATMTPGRDTNVTAATERTLSAAACTKGIWMCNANAAGIVYAGMAAASISATLHLWRLLPGQSVFVPGITNADQIGWCTDTNGLNLDYGTI